MIFISFFFFVQPLAVFCGLGAKGKNLLTLCTSHGAGLFLQEMEDRCCYQAAIGQNADLFPHLEFATQCRIKAKRRLLTKPSMPLAFSFAAADGAEFPALCPPPPGLGSHPCSVHTSSVFAALRQHRRGGADWSGAPQRCPHKLFVFGCLSSKGSLQTLEESQRNTDISLRSIYEIYWLHFSQYIFARVCVHWP